MMQSIVPQKKDKKTLKSITCYKCGLSKPPLMAMRDGKLNKKSGRRLATEYYHSKCPTSTQSFL